ncbi:MAG: choice-of-anchor Q domain-containing protein [Pyrinomonadaceae bacterium]
MILQITATIGLFVFVLAAFDRVSAATFTVTKVEDTLDGVCNSDCSLREAITLANAASSDDFVVFDPVFFAVPRTVILNGTEIPITNNGAIIISGPGANLLTISGNDLSRVFMVNINVLASFYDLTIAHGKATFFVDAIGGGAVFVRTGATAAFTNATIANNIEGPAVYADASGSLIFNTSIVRDNISSGSGAGIFSRGATFLTDSSFTGNVIGPLSDNRGGAIYALANMTITRCTFSNNVAGSGTTGDGGAIGVGGGITTIVDSTLQNNHAFRHGGAILANGGGVTLTNSLVTNNIAGGSGGGIQGGSTGGTQGGVMTLVNSTVSNNVAESGGGLTADNLTLTGAQIIDNQSTGGSQGGGGVIIRGRATITGSTISNNSTIGFGGGILGQNSIQNLPINITDSQVNSNSAGIGGAIYIARGPVTLNHCDLLGNHASEGGAIYNDNPFNTLTINQSTLDGNTAIKEGGGIVVNGGTIVNDSSISSNTVSGTTGLGGAGILVLLGTPTITNSSITGNVSAKQGGGIYNRRTVNLIHVTVNNNSAMTGGGGIYSRNTFQVNSRNSIIGDNYDSSGTAPDYFGSFVSQGFNLIENTVGTTITGITTGNILGKDPQLVPIRPRGGPTSTVGLQPTSPAIDAADPVNFVATDQRGVARPQDGDLNATNLPDIGAYERQVVIYTVTKALDTGDGVCDTDCSLREALTASNSAISPDNVIVFDTAAFSTPRTIVLTGGELVLESYSSLLIRGGGPNMLTIDGNNQCRVFTNRLGAFAVLEGLTVTGGNGVGELMSGHYGGIYNAGTLNIINAEIRNNSAAGNGGAIGNGLIGTLILLRTTVRNNAANGLAGGGIYNQGNLITVTNSTIDHNSAGTAGGGIANALGSIIVSASTVSGNNAADGGGGLSNIDPNALITVSSTTIADNSANHGGGMTTVLAVKVGNSIIADNRLVGGTAGVDVEGGIDSLGYNLIERDQGAILTGILTGNILGQDPQLLMLANNGGPTRTHALRRTSPVIDKGGALGGSVDQRGNPRPYDHLIFANAPGGNGVDIGAFERQAIDVPMGVNSDFDGDGKTDVSVFRPNSGRWYTIYSSSNEFVDTAFGLGGDQVTPADYDGDGRSDVAVFRAGYWYILDSSNGSFRAEQFGAAGDLPAPGDFDGDGKADLTVFRPSAGAWYLLQSRDGFKGVQFGANGDKPVVADYDGDGRSDIGVFREGAWYLLQSTSGFTGVQFGFAGDVPVAGDYDGDGRADQAVYRQGIWYLLRSTAGFTGINFGNSSDRPAPGDYDGDGKNDIVVFRGGDWYFLKSATGAFSTQQFGSPGDIPVPGAFVP